MQTNDFPYIEIITFSHTIKYELLAFDMNTWNYTSVGKSFVLERNA